MNDAGGDAHKGTGPVKWMPEAGASLSWAVFAYRFSPPLRLRTQFVVLRGGHKMQSPAAALPLAFRRRKRRRRPASIDMFTHPESTLVNPETDRRTFTRSSPASGKQLRKPRDGIGDRTLRLPMWICLSAGGRPACFAATPDG